MLIQLERFLNKFDINFKKSDLKPRLNASNGLWCCTLLPIIFILTYIKYDVPTIYVTVMLASFGLLMDTVIFILFASISSNMFHWSLQGAPLLSSLICCFSCYYIMEASFLTSVTISFFCICFYNSGMRLLMRLLPRAFTWGEVMIIMQSLTLFLFSTFVNISAALNEKYETENKVISLTCQMCLFTALTIVCFMLNFPSVELNQSLSTIGIFGFIAISVLHILLKKSIVLWLINYILLDSKKVILILFWACLVFVTYSIVFDDHTGVIIRRKATTAQRKAFHILASIVFISGIVYDLNIIRLAATVGFSLLILIEVARINAIEPFGKKLEEAFKTYADEKDIGGVSLTPIYLFLGISAPLILIPTDDPKNLIFFSGVLSIGIGDSAASYFGSKYGKHKWKDSMRTMEGTLANIVSQVIVVLILQFCGAINGNNIFIKSIVSSIITAVFEASTDQIDNLILPLVDIIVLLIVL